jgi:hypothetical protein
VSPAVSKIVTVDDHNQVLIAWNMQTSGLYDNFTGSRPSVCMGQTIFGMTSANTDGSCEIYDINFAKSVDEYLSTTHLSEVRPASPSDGNVYTLGGIRVEHSMGQKQVYVCDGKKIVK